MLRSSLPDDYCAKHKLAPPVPSDVPLPQVVQMAALEYWPAMETARDKYSYVFDGSPSQRDVSRGVVRFETVCAVACTVSMTYKPAFLPLVIDIHPKPNATVASLAEEITPLQPAFFPPHTTVQLAAAKRPKP